MRECVCVHCGVVPVYTLAPPGHQSSAPHGLPVLPAPHFDYDLEMGTGRHPRRARAQFFRRMHALYADTVANPFHTPDTELHACATFQRQIGRIVEAGLFTGVRVGTGGV